VEIISQILDRIDLSTGTANNGQLLVHKNEFRTNLELFAFRINWPGFPGLQNLLLKGCTCPSTGAVEATQRLLVQLIPHCSKLNFIEPSVSEGLSTHGLNGVALNLLALLPTLILNYERPSEMCIKAAQGYFKVSKWDGRTFLKSIFKSSIVFLERSTFKKNLNIVNILVWLKRD
jgi:hypothetical protein